jgi:hypothetical protein
MAVGTKTLSGRMLRRSRSICAPQRQPWYFSRDDVQTQTTLPESADDPDFNGCFVL